MYLAKTMDNEPRLTGHQAAVLFRSLIAAGMSREDAAEICDDAVGYEEECPFDGSFNPQALENLPTPRPEVYW